MKNFFSSSKQVVPKFPGLRAALDGNSAVASCEREASDAAGAYPITPSTQMGEYWAEAAAAGHINISERPLIFVEPEGEHAAAAVTAGLSMSGLRSANFSSGQGVAYMHESLYAAVGKRLTYVLNIGARAMTKATLNVHAGHDDYHCIDDTGFFQLFAKNAQHAADLNLVAHRVAELALTPGAVAQDGFLTTHLIESLMVPERELIAQYLGRPDDLIETPTAAQRMIYGDTRRRIPVLWDVDNPVMSGLVQNQDAYMQSVAAQRPFFFEHILELTERAFEEYAELTGRHYSRIMTYRVEDAEYLIVGQGSLVPSAEAVADYLRETRKLKVGVVDLVMWRPFPADLLSRVLRGRKGVAVLERLDQPLAVDLPMVREIRATLSKSLENGHDPKHPAYPELATYKQLSDAPPVYSGSFGLGSRDLQPEGLVAAIENMLPAGSKRKFFYLSIDFAHREPVSPKALLHQQKIDRSYPGVKDLVLRGSENPNLMPKGSITVRLHSVGGWGAITTGKNLAMTLFDLLGYHVKANPKYGSEKKGQPTTYYLSAAPEPIRVNCEYHYVDVVLSPDPHVLQHTNALAGLRQGGTFVIQSDKSPEQTWAALPVRYRQTLVEQGIHIYCIDAFQIARDEATDPELQLRMQGIAFQGAFFRTSGVLEQKGLSEERLLEAIRAQIQHKFGDKGARVVEDNMRVIRRGFDEVKPVPTSPPQGAETVAQTLPRLPIMLQHLPKSRAPVSDVHRFWEQTGSLYARGMGNEQLADPFISLGTMPAHSAVFRDMTGIRFKHPAWISENCTACGACYTVCPDTAIAGLVHDVSQVFETLVSRIKRERPLEHLQRASRVVERELRALLREAGNGDSVEGLLEEAIAKTLEQSELEGDERKALAAELDAFRNELDGFAFSRTRTYYEQPEKKRRDDGGLLSITVNPYTCKGCMECVEVCPDNALEVVPQTEESVDKLRRHWDLWLDLPTTHSKYSRISDLEQGAGALHTLLLDKRNTMAVSSGDGACLGCSEKTVIRLFVATVEALMQARVEKHVAYLDGLIVKFEGHVRRKLASDLGLGDPSALVGLLGDGAHRDLTLGKVADALGQQGQVIDRAWLARTGHVLGELRELRFRYQEGTAGRARSHMGIVNSTGCSSVWGSTYPFNPYPFPWTNHLFQDSPSIAMGVFEGHMAKMAQGFAAIRGAELELAGTYRTREHDQVLRRLNWQQFTDQEWELCPPVVSVGGDGAMYDIGFQNLSRALMSGKPIKFVVLDTQVYSNTGGQACTSGFLGQISDMAQFGKAQQGKQEVRKEIGLIAMAHRTAYVMQSTIAHPAHMIEGFIQGLKAKRPALFNLYTACQPEHGIGDDRGAAQARLAVESRAYPLFRYDPERGDTPEACLDLEGNPGLDRDMPSYTLRYQEFKRTRELQLAMTFADFALTEARFRKHFRHAPKDTWNDNMLPLAEFLELDAEARSGKFPFVWTVDRSNKLGRLMVDAAMVASSEDRLQFWRTLRNLAGGDRAAPRREDIEASVRQDLARRIATGIMQLSLGETAAPELSVERLAVPAPEPAPDGHSEYMAPWLDTDACSSCDECIKINSRVFKYNEDGKAFIADPDAGSYEQLVKAAERCTAGVIHPGLPRDRSVKGIDSLIGRAAPFN